MKNPLSKIISGWKQLAVLSLGLALGATPAIAQRPIGVDVSHYDLTVNWTNVKNSGIVFAWAKATEGTGNVDPYFTINVPKATSFGIPISGYHFAHPESDAPASEENHYWSVAGPYIQADGLTMSPMLDMEVFTGVTGATSYADWVNQWCNALVADATAQGVKTKPSIYVSACAAGNFNTTVAQWFSDIANYSGNNPQTSNPWTSCSAYNVWGAGNWNVWQYTDAAIAGDGDVFNGTTADLFGTMVAGIYNTNINPCVTTTSDGRLEAFAIGTGGHLFTDYQNTPNGTWSGWVQMGVSSNVWAANCIPAVATNVDGRLELFIVSTNGAVDHIKQLTPGSSAATNWSAFSVVTSSRVSLTAKLAAGNWANGTVDIFVVGTDGVLYHNNQTTPGGATWTGFTSLGGSWSQDDDIAVNRELDGRLEVFLVGLTGSLYNNWQTTNNGTAWNGFHNLGGLVAEDVRTAVARNTDGRLEAFILGTDGLAYHQFENAANGPTAWSGWASLGGNWEADAKILVGSDLNGDLKAFIIGSAGTMLVNDQAGGWASWVSLGGIFKQNARPCLGKTQNGLQQIFLAPGLNTTMQNDWEVAPNSSTWSGWFNIGSAPALSITTQPSSQTISAGQNAAFSVVGVNALTYQWRFNGGNISGATTTSYTVVNAQTVNAGSYSVVLGNAGGTLTSTNAILNIAGTPPSITTQPVGQTVIQGQNAAFSVVAAGSAPLVYQWTFNAATISGATASSYTVISAQSTDAGNYAVVITNAAGSVTSANAALVVNVPPSISTQPVSQTVNQGQNATFSVVAAGTAPLAYQWRLNTLSIIGATDSSYTRVSCQSSDVGSYSVQITNVAGSIISADALLAVQTPPTIVTQPASQLANVSNTVVLTVSATGTAPLTYQWRKNGTAISGATLSSLTLAGLKWTNAGSYTVVVSNVVSSATSSTAVLTVEQAAFSWTEGFESDALGGLDRNLAGGPNTGAANPWWGVPTLPDMTVFTNRAGVTPHGGTKMISATTNINICQEYLNLPYRMNAGSNYYGNFMLDWWFYDTKGAGAGSSTYVDYIAVAQNQPVSLTNDVVSTSFTNFNQRMSLGAYNGSGYHSNVYQARLVSAVGGFNTSGWFNTVTPRTVGWHHGRMIVGIPVANSGPVQMFVDNMTNATFNYSTSGTNVGFNLIEINSSFGGANTGGYFDDFTFRAANDPWIAQQPVNTTVATGANTSFTTVAIGTAYQWQFNGANISGATATSYPITGAVAGDAGTYNCVITGANGTTNTTSVTLTVQ